MIFMVAPRRPIDEADRRTGAETLMTMQLGKAGIDLGIVVCRGLLEAGGFRPG